jgi:anaerobic ribonucleoside-triphosphate reductase
MVQYHTGQQLHESNDAIKMGLKIIAHMYSYAKEIGEKHGIHMPLEQTPAESTAYRMAKLDMRHFPLQTPLVVKGLREAGEIYYTNSTYLNVSEPINSIIRVKKEGLYHNLIEAGALSHVWLGEAQPDPNGLANFVTKTFNNTQNAQIAFSPEFTSCMSCNRVSRGLSEKCPYCNSESVEGITRVTGFFSKTSSWNKGKLGELKQRFRVGDIAS